MKFFKKKDKLDLWHNQIIHINFYLNIYKRLKKYNKNDQKTLIIKLKKINNKIQIKNGNNKVILKFYNI